MTEPSSAWAWAQERLAAGETLPDPAELPAEWFTLVAAVRRLSDAVLRTDLPAEARAEIAADLDALTDRLAAVEREPTVFVAQHASGQIDNLTQAGSGLLNPQAPAVTFVELPPPPAPGSPPEGVEVIATCTLTAVHSGPPGRAHGGVVATLLDEVIGRAANAAGASGLTAGIDVRFRAGTPCGVPLEIRARFTHAEGRKSFASGEILARGTVTANATAVFIAPKSLGQ